MADKVQKIREEVARIQAYTQSDVLKEVLDYIDKVQEEPKPKFKIGDCIKPIESSLGSPRTIVDVCDSWYVTDQGTLDFEYEDNWKAVGEPVSEDLEEASKNYALNNTPWDDCKDEIQESFNAGANWKEQQMMAKAIDGVVTFDYYDSGDKTYGCVAHDSFCLENFGLKDKDKVKVIVIKED